MKTSIKQNIPYIEPPIVTSEQGAHLTIDGKDFINLCSNNYLGLAADPRLKTAAIQAIETYGVGTASVRALIGTNSFHIELEKKLAAFKGAEAAIVLTGGYMANLAVIQTVLDKDDVVISDELNHASIIDAIRLSGVKNKFIYKHADIGDLKNQTGDIKKLLDVKKADGSSRQCILVPDGVFSMDGDIAPLPELVTWAHEQKIMVMVDDAHGEGVLGNHGRGIVDHFGLHNKIDFEVGTLSKAFGVMGGFVTGTKETIELLKQKSRQFLFSNGLSIPDTAALIEAVSILEESDERVKKLWENTRYLQSKLKEHKFDIGKTQTPITPVMIGYEEKAMQMSAGLKKLDIMVSTIKFPMVAKGSARLRLMPSSLHTHEDLDKSIEALLSLSKNKSFSSFFGRIGYSVGKFIKKIIRK